MKIEKKVAIFGKESKEEQEFWVEKLSQVSGSSNLIPDYERPPVYSSSNDSLQISLPEELNRKLCKLTNDSLFLLYTTLLAGLKICLHRYTGSDSIVVGSPARIKPEEATQAANALAIVDQLDEDSTVQQLLLKVRATLLEAYGKQNYPFARLVRDLKLEGIENRCPLFDVAMLLNGLHGPLPEVRNDITITFERREQEITGTLEFNRSLFQRSSIERFAAHLVQVLGEALEDTGRKISELQLLTEAERRQLLVEWNETEADYQGDLCVHEMFEAQVERTPDATALLFEGQQMTYRELDQRANQLAHHLRKSGVGQETLVAVYLRRSPLMIVGLLGILKAGGAYLPLDPTYPSERLSFMLEDSSAPLVLTQRELTERLPQCEARVLSLETEAEAIAAESIERPHVNASADNLAYVIYTSGSTGKPKGVLVQHRGVCNLSSAQSGIFGVGPQDRVLQFASLSFDASAFEIVMALLKGATLCLENQDSLLLSQTLIEALREQAITNATLPPSVLASLPEESLPALRTLIVAGEACPSELVTRWANGREFFNAYGPTESTVWATVARCLDMTRKPPIGRPIFNTKIYILDAAGRPVPIGVPGELHIGGVALARGYLNRPELTAERFIPNPWNAEAGARLYRTGDLARYLPDGDIEFLGRIDEQVKIRGYRIELGEIEAVLDQLPGVREAVLVAREEMSGEKRLVAYVVAAGEESTNVSDLRSALREKLPEYMVPAFFVTVDEIPLTANGKVDRRALPAPDQSRPELVRNYVEPRTPVEATLAAIWCQVIGIEKVGIYDNFFELGGHSLMATQLVSRVREAFNVELPLKAFFSVQPTVARLTELIEELQLEQSSDDEIAGMLEELDKLSDEEVAHLLAGESQLMNESDAG
jgi:amino acid adenylation domain-containing protein